MSYRIVVGIAVVCIALCMGAAVFLHLKVVETWNDVAIRQQKLDAAPAEALQTTKMKKEFTAANDRFAVLQHMTVPKDGLPDVVTAIMKAGSDSNVIVQVPEVSQNTAKTSSDSLQDVRMHISASGAPASLISFLYRLEQLPYLVYVASWTIDTTHQVSLSAFAGIAPTTSPVPAAPQGSSLETDIVISTMK